jgi:transposase InsO family protein
MSKNGIQACHKHRYRVTTDFRHKLPVAPNLLNREFAPAVPNRVFGSDITSIWADDGWLYLAVALDLFNREVVGWSIVPCMTADIVTDAHATRYRTHREAAVDCSDRSKCSTTAVVVIRRSALCRRPSSCETGSRLNRQRKRLHNPVPLEGEKQREGQIANH